MCLLFHGLSLHRNITHMRTELATIAMMPIEKMPTSANLLLIGTLKLSSAGIGSNRIITSVNRFTAALNTHRRIGS